MMIFERDITKDESPICSIAAIAFGDLTWVVGTRQDRACGASQMTWVSDVPMSADA